MVVAGVDLLPAPASGPGVAELAADTAGGRFGHAQQVTDLGHADLDQAGSSGGGSSAGGGNDPASEAIVSQSLGTFPDEHAGSKLHHYVR